uniref:Gem-associated protein 5 n=1 Tax=Dendroctonus ponderosae TaxID=77166 RepID=A0AAR5PFF8_DENPD
MEPAINPPGPSWYLTNIMACAPDNTLIYGACMDLVVITPNSLTKRCPAGLVNVVTPAHASKIISVNINRNWGLPYKYAVSTSEIDHTVKVWDVERLEKKTQRKFSKDGTVVGAAFAGDERVVVVFESGQAIVWNIAKEETTETIFLLNKVVRKSPITCFSVCPHASWLLALGMKNGLIVVVDIRGPGASFFTLRGHAHKVLSLSWCPAPVNIFPKTPNMRVIEKTRESQAQQILNPSVESEVAHVGIEGDSNKVAGAVNEGSDGVELEIAQVENLCSRKFVDSVQEQRTPPIQESSTFNDSIVLNSTSSTPLGNNDELIENVAIPQVSEALNDNAGGAKSLPEKACQKGANSEEELTKAPKRNNKEKKLASQLITSQNQEDTNRDVELSASLSLENISSGTSSVSEVQRDTDSMTDRRVLSMDLTLCDEPHPLILETIPKDSKISETETALDEQDQSNIAADGPVHGDIQSSEELAALAPQKIPDWRAENKNPVCTEEQPRKEYLLASSAQEDNIYIWRAGTDGRLQTLLKPSKTYANNKFAARKAVCWTTVCWISPNILLSSNASAKLVKWTLPKPSDERTESQLLHDLHYKALTAIAAPITYCNEYNFLQNRSLTAWSIGVEKLLVNYDVSNSKRNIIYCTGGGSASCCAVSPMDPYRLAIGTSNREVHIWKISHLDETYYPGVFYEKILGAVTALAWHSSKENCLAWGTVEGRIGVIDVSKGKNPTILPHYFKEQIHKLEWGPFRSTTDEHNLFAVSEGKLAIFVWGRTGDPYLLQIPNGLQIYSMSWKPDFSYLLVLSKSGTMFRYSLSSSEKFELDEVFYSSLKLESIAWHPQADQAGNNSVYSQMFASIEKFNHMCIIDLSIKSGDFGEKVVAKFDNYENTKINEIKWNPHVAQQIILIDDNSVAQIFDIEAKAIIHTFISSALDPLLCVYWAPDTNKDALKLIIGTKLRKMLFFYNFDYPPVAPEDIADKVKKMRRVSSKAGQSKGPKVEEPKTNTPKTPRKSPVVPHFYLCGSVDEEKLLEDMKKLLLWKLTGECEGIDSKKSDIDILHVFGSEDHLTDLFQINYSKLRSAKQLSHMNMLSLFEGDISTVYKQAVEEKRVDSWNILMAPLVSSELWKKAYEIYATQLMDEPESDPMQIVSLLLACHKVEESVNFLCEKQMFREAFLLAKTRCGANSALVVSTLTKWANVSYIQGLYEQTACCYISTGNYSAAAELLHRRTSVPMLEMSAYLAKLANNEELLQSVQVKLRKLAESDDELGESRKLDSNLEAVIDTYLTQFASETAESLPFSEITNRQLGTSFSSLNENDENVASGYQDPKERHITMINNMKLDESLMNRLPYPMHKLMEMFDCPLHIGCENTLTELESDFLQIALGDQDDTHTSISDTIPEHPANEQ